MVASFTIIAIHMACMNLKFKGNNVKVPFTLLPPASLAKLVYTNVKEFVGIIDWPYEVEK